MDLNRLINAKEKLKLSSVDIAARSGVPVSTVYKIFQGQTSNPRPDTIAAIEKVLGLRYEVSENSPVLAEEDTSYGNYISGSNHIRSNKEKCTQYQLQQAFAWSVIIKRRLNRIFPSPVTEERSEMAASMEHRI